MSSHIQPSSIHQSSLIQKPYVQPKLTRVSPLSILPQPRITFVSATPYPLCILLSSPLSVYASGIFPSLGAPVAAPALLNMLKFPNQLPLFAAFLALCSSSVFCTNRSGLICFPVMVLPISRRGGLGVSTWEFSDEDLASASRSLSRSSAPCSDGGAPAPAPEGTREEGMLLLPVAALMGMPKKEFRGETSPGEVGEAAAGGARNMLVTRLEEGTSDVERR